MEHTTQDKQSEGQHTSLAGPRKASQVGTAEWRKTGPEAAKHIRQCDPRVLRFGLGNNISPSLSPQVRTAVPTQPWPSRAMGLPSPRAPNPTSTRDLLPSGRRENKDQAYINLYTWGAGHLILIKLENNKSTVKLSELFVPSAAASV